MTGISTNKANKVEQQYCEKMAGSRNTIRVQLEKNILSVLGGKVCRFGFIHQTQAFGSQVGQVAHRASEIGDDLNVTIDLVLIICEI